MSAVVLSDERSLFEINQSVVNVHHKYLGEIVKKNLACQGVKIVRKTKVCLA
jgi:hypothetical protein